MNEAEHPRLRKAERLFAGPQRLFQLAGPDMQEAMEVEPELGEARRVGVAGVGAGALGRGDQRQPLIASPGADPPQREAKRRRTVACRSRDDLGHGPGGGVLKRLFERLGVTRRPLTEGGRDRHRNELEQKENMRNLRIGAGPPLGLDPGRRGA